MDKVFLCIHCIILLQEKKIYGRIKQSNADIMHYGGCYLSHGRHMYPFVMIRNVLAPGKEYATWAQAAPKQFTLIFDDVIIVP